MLRRFRDGERPALEAVYCAYVAEIEQIGRRGFFAAAAGVRIPGVPARADLADFVQEVFTKAFARGARQAFDGARDYGPYVGAIARHVLIDRARRGGREVPLSNELLDSLQATPGDNNADGALPIGGDEAASPEAAEAAPIVERYLSELSPELRAVYHQRYELGLFQVAAATNLGLTRQMLRTLEDKLKKGLARAIKRGRSWPAAAAAAAVTPRPVELPVRADK